MTTEEWAKLIISNGAIGAMGAICGAILGATALWIFNSRLALKARRADFLREQVKNLYGPVTFLLQKGERAIEVHSKILANYEEYFKTRHGGEHFSKQMTMVIGIQNEFGALAKAGMKEAAAILKSSWGWLDAADGDAVRDFLTFVDRLEIEFDNEGKVRLPYEFYHSLKNSLPAPVIHDSKLVSRFRQKLQEKQAELAGLNPPMASPERSEG